MEEMQYLRAIEAQLTHDPAFGDSVYIIEQTDACYRRRLDKISGAHPTAGAVLCGLLRPGVGERRRVLGDTVVRFAINAALLQVESGVEASLSPDQCDAVFRDALDRLEAAPPPKPGRFPAVWSGGQADAGTDPIFRALVKARFRQKTRPDAELATPTDEDLERLRRGAALLEALAPSLSRGALDHVDLIALFPLEPWNGAASMSQFGLSGTIFLCRDLLHSPWWVAEHLLHEALHQKLYDFRHGHSLLDPEFRREGAPRVCSLWNTPGPNGSNLWDSHRALAAFHVYVHLALLSAVAEERAPELEAMYGPRLARPGMTSSRKAMERAHYLGENLSELCQGELGLAGRRLVDWLMAALDALDDAPPPAKSCIHLLMDRYRGEARSTEAKVRACCGETALVGRLGRLAAGEVETARSVMARLEAREDLRSFDQALADLRVSESGADFASVRTLIATSILAVARDGYRLDRPGATDAADDMVRSMVEDSSQRLHQLFAGEAPS